MAKSTTPSKNEPQSEDDKFYRFFNLKKVGDITGIQLDKIYNNLKDHYKSFSKDDKKAIADTLKPNVEELFGRLGIEVTFKAIK